jgi:hypothetical protein
MTTPPTIPAIKPLITGTPEACAIPKHNGNATKNTTMEAEMSLELNFIDVKLWKKSITIPLIRRKHWEIRQSTMGKIHS